MKTENLLNLKIHKLSNNQYKNVVNSGELDTTAIYLTPPPTLEGNNITVVDDEANNKVTFTVANGTVEQKGVVQLNSEVDSSNESTAATPKGVVSAIENLVGPAVGSLATTIDNLNMSTPEASGNTVEFIDSVTQEAGQVTVTKKTITAASVTTPGIVQLNNTLSSTSTTQAATANTVKMLADRIEEKVNDLADNVTVKVASATLEKPGIVQLSSTPSSTVENRAVTPKGVNAAFAANYILTGQKSGSTHGTCATIEGFGNSAAGDYSHAGGAGTAAGGDYSFAHGLGVIANTSYQTAVGKYNQEDSHALFMVGNGTSSNAPNTVFKVMDNGRAKVSNLSVNADEDLVPLGALKSWILDVVYPVGAIYISRLAEASPEANFGGTWKRITNNTLFVARSSGDLIRSFDISSCIGTTTHNRTVMDHGWSGGSGGQSHRYQLFYKGGSSVINIAEDDLRKCSGICFEALYGGTKTWTGWSEIRAGNYYQPENGYIQVDPPKGWDNVISASAITKVHFYSGHLRNATDRILSGVNSSVYGDYLANYSGLSALNSTSILNTEWNADAIDSAAPKLMDIFAWVRTA